MAAAKRKRRPAKPDEPRVMHTITRYCTTSQHEGCDGTSLDRICICDCHNADEIQAASELAADEAKEATDAST